jgi:hypothetical protein
MFSTAWNAEFYFAGNARILITARWNRALSATSGEWKACCCSGEVEFSAARDGVS